MRATNTALLTLLFSLAGIQNAFPQVITTSASYEMDAVGSSCTVSGETQAVCPSAKAYSPSGWLFIQTWSSAEAVYGFISIAGIADANPTSECQQPDINCTDGTAVQAASSGGFDDLVTVIRGPESGTLVATYNYQTNGGALCGGTVWNGLVGPDPSACGPGNAPYVYYDPNSVNQIIWGVPTNSTFNQIIPFTLGVAFNFSASLSSAVNCGADDVTSCYGGYGAILSLRKLQLLDSNGVLWKRGTLSAASGTDYNPILEASTGQGAAIIEPALVNVSVPLATEVAHLSGLKVAIATSEVNATVPAGSVISQSPPAGTQLSKGSTVSLVVSNGAFLTTVPRVIHQTPYTAMINITAAGLEPGIIKNKPSTTVVSGEVISQSPKAGTNVATPSNVNLVVSSGPPAAGTAILDDETDDQLEP